MRTVVNRPAPATSVAETKINRFDRPEASVTSDEIRPATPSPAQVFFVPVEPTTPRCSDFGLSDSGNKRCRLRVLASKRRRKMMHIKA